MRRRAFITLLGGAAAAWPLVASAQQPAMPVIGFLDSRSSDGMATRLAAFRQGLKEVGLVEGENVTIIYRWAEGRVDRLPEMASELARQATVIVTSGGPPAAFAAKAATTTPIVFLVGEDRPGSVSSPASPAPAAISRGSICWPTNWRPSDCSSCTSSCPKLSASPSS
jgi:putative tryptophan/tyrosine transport system substrate-binding protein